MKKSETNSNCQYYNWGGSGKYSSYPREYGARCEKYDRFFTKDFDGNKEILKPQCWKCKYFKRIK